METQPLIVEIEANLTNMEDENDTLYDPTTTCWDDDKNHTEGDFH